MPQNRLVLLEESRVVRECLASAIAAQSEFVVVDAVADGAELLRAAHDGKAHLALVSVESLGDDAVQAVRDLKRAVPAMRVVGMGLTAGQFDVVALIRAGVAAFVMQEATFDQLLATLRSAVAGRHVLPTELAPRVFSGIAGATWTRVSGRARITARESQIIDLIVEGYGNKDIARELDIAVQTVKTHVHNILEKLEVRTRLQIASLIRIERIAPPPSRASVRVSRGKRAQRNPKDVDPLSLHRPIPR